MRHPSRVLTPNEAPFRPLLGIVAAQLKVTPAVWSQYARRDETRREHPQEILERVELRQFDRPAGVRAAALGAQCRCRGEIDRRFYEFCALSALKNRLWAGDLHAVSSRQFRDFEDYLMPTAAFSSM